MVALEGVGGKMGPVGSVGGLGSERHVNSETAAWPGGQMTRDNFNSFRPYNHRPRFCPITEGPFLPSEEGGAKRSAALFSSGGGLPSRAHFWGIATHD